jgi:hypothetical protein
MTVRCSATKGLVELNMMQPLTSSSGSTDGRRPGCACGCSEGISCSDRMRRGVVGEVVPAWSLKGGVSFRKLQLQELLGTTHAQHGGNCPADHLGGLPP